MAALCSRPQPPAGFQARTHTHRHLPTPPPAWQPSFLTLLAGVLARGQKSGALKYLFAFFQTAGRAASWAGQGGPTSVSVKSEWGGIFGRAAICTSMRPRRAYHRAPAIHRSSIGQHTSPPRLTGTMARFHAAVLAIALFGLIAVATAESHASRELQGWDWPNVRVLTPVGRVNVRPYAWNVQNFVGGNWVMPQWWVSGFPEATGAKGGGRRLLGWDWPNVRVLTPVGRVNVRPYSTNVQNIVGGNWLMPQWWVSGFPEATGDKKP